MSLPGLKRMVRLQAALQRKAQSRSRRGKLIVAVVAAGHPFNRIGLKEARRDYFRSPLRLSIG